MSNQNNKRRIVAGHCPLPQVIRYAQTVFAATSRMTAEATALAGWMAETCRALGIAEADVPRTSGRGANAARIGAASWKRIETVLAGAVTRALADPEPAPCEWLGTIVKATGFDALEARMLALIVHYRTDQRVEALYNAMSQARGRESVLRADARLFALLLGACEDEVLLRLGSDGRLLSSGLVSIGYNEQIDVLYRFVRLVRRRTVSETELLDRLLGPRASSKLDWEAFAHLGREADLAATVLRAATQAGERGINILLYGPPGTGKTSFAASLAARAGLALHPVGESDEDGDEQARQGRLCDLLLAQRLAGTRQAVLLFDEAEDLFGPSRNEDGQIVQGSRVFIHRMLEQMSVPVIWTANDIGKIGPAALRRMTLCLELRLPGVATRATLWRRMAEQAQVVLAESDADQLARQVPASPAIAASALRAAKLAGGGAAETRLALEGVARAVNGGPLPPQEASAEVYDPALINADIDLAALTERLIATGMPRNVSLLLSGPPGSGKSAYARHLAERMGMTLLQKRASDLLDMYLGNTEKRIAAAFAEARADGAFLVFDEADSLLGERADAVRSWEVSQVNEMLTWMEQHPLPFACTTNLAERLDRASLRRFLVKARFGYLTAAQARLAFRRFFSLPAPDGLDMLRTLTPADYALVRRRALLTGDTGDAQALLTLLRAECAGRIGNRAPLGFAAA